MQPDNFKLFLKSLLFIFRGIKRKALIILLIVTSCSAGKYSAHNPPGFFVCNEWKDKNMDGIWDYTEFKGTKDIFRANETVMFVGYFVVPQGTTLKLEIIAPDHTTYRELIFHQDQESEMFNFKQSVQLMISKKLPGLWLANWYIDNKMVAKIPVSLVN
jgi:hypothetical protein